MAFIRNCIIIAVTFFCIGYNAKAQTVYYPAQSSKLLKATAEDAAMLFQKAIAGSKFTTQSYSTMPSTGVIFIYDTTITDYQACKVQSDGANYIKFTAAGDNGPSFWHLPILTSTGFQIFTSRELFGKLPLH